MSEPAFVYVLRCTDGSLYCGITTDYRRRIAEHFFKGRKCAKYTRSHSVCAVCMVLQAENYSVAASCEAKFKRLKKPAKEAALCGDLPDFMKQLVPVIYQCDEIPADNK